METFEHKLAGDEIRLATIENDNNPYLIGGTNLNADAKDVLSVVMMQCIEEIPVPLHDLTLTAGDIVAMAGDYFSSPGWGQKLRMPPRVESIITENRQIFSLPVIESEHDAFMSAYNHLASPELKKSDIDNIFAISQRTYIPFFTSLNSLVQELVLAWKVKDYYQNLNSNESHFAPWSARAYIVAHHLALRNAKQAYDFAQLAAGKITLENASSETRKILLRITTNPQQFNLTLDSDVELYTELAHRYHTLAICQDLFAMHFYSDHFAAGHMSRVGRMRLDLPRKFGIWGSILVNNAHNEDNFDNVTTTNPFQPPIGPLSDDQPFTMLREENAAYGDGTYRDDNNRGNRNLLINGMDNSLGDIYRARSKGAIRHNWEYGGLAFMPEIDLHKRQKQPLFLQDCNGEIYYRTNISQIRVLSPLEYQDTRLNPTEHGYTKLTTWKAFIIAFKLRVLGFFYSPKIIGHNMKREKEILEEENRLPPMKGVYSMSPPVLNDEPLLNEIPEESLSVSEQDTNGLGGWRHTTPAEDGEVSNQGIFKTSPKSQRLLAFLKTEQRTPEELETDVLTPGC